MSDFILGPSKLRIRNKRNVCTWERFCVSIDAEQLVVILTDIKIDTIWLFSFFIKKLLLV